MGSQARQIEHSRIEKAHEIDALSILLELHTEAESLLFKQVTQYSSLVQQYEDWENKLAQQLQKLCIEPRKSDIPGVEALLKLTHSGANSSEVFRLDTISNWHFKHRTEFTRALAQQNASCLAVWPTLAVLLEIEQNLAHYQQGVEHHYLAQRYNGFLHLVDTVHRHRDIQLEPACALPNQPFRDVEQHHSQALSLLLSAQQTKAEFETITHYSAWAAQALLRSKPAPSQLPLNTESLERLHMLLKLTESVADRFLQWRCWCYQNQWPRTFIVQGENLSAYAIDGINPLFLELLAQRTTSEQQTCAPTFYRTPSDNDDIRTLA